MPFALKVNRSHDTDDACANYRESMQALEALETELSAHANVEESVLAPRVRALLAPVYA